LDLVTRTPPDLSTFQSDSSGIGMYKLQSAMDAQTVPDVPSTELLPAHSDSDLNFLIQKSTETIPLVRGTLPYLDWNGAEWSAQTYGGWFVQTCKGSNCTQADSINANIRYTDWSGTNWTGARVGDKFISTKNKPASTDKDCPPDPATGVSAGPDFSKCVSFVSNSLQLKAPGGVLERVSLSVSKPSMVPVFTSEPTLPFTPGILSSQTITASGNPAPRICYAGSKPGLPPEFSFKGACQENGQFQLLFNGNPISAEQIYQLTMSASNGTTAQPVFKTFALDVSQHVAITSPSRLTGTAGFPVNFQVTTTGFPPPSLSVDPGLLSFFPGLIFKDNGNGTGTISGTAGRPGNRFCVLIDDKPTCGITASNSRETVLQAFGIDLAPAPAASLGPPSDAIFVAGASNSVVVASTGASTHVSWNFKSGPPWIKRLVDNGNGTATLFGNPPAGTTGTSTAEIAPIATGSNASVIPVFTPFPVTVVNKPTFLSPNTATFTAGSSGSFAISASEGNIGAISGRLPPGLSFTGGNPATIAGIPAAESGGQYPLEVTDSVAGGVSIYGPLTLNVNQAPGISSPNRATFTTELPGSFTVTTSGFPNVSAQPVTQPLTPPTNPNEGKGMYFTVTGLPAGLTASNLNPQGNATGTLTIQGTPLPGDAGLRSVQIMARNGVGATAQQTLTLDIAKLKGAAPATGNECNGAYFGTYEGDIGVRLGQDCIFVGGVVNGSVTVIGGDFTLSKARVTGNVLIEGSSAFSISAGSEIDGNLTMQDVSSGVSQNPLCASRVAGDLLVSNNDVPIEIGSSQTSCLGNTFGRDATITNNTDSIQIYNNQITRTLTCRYNLSIAGGGNTAPFRTNQCIPFVK